MAGKKPLIVSLVGARPQFIKLAPLAQRLSPKAGHIIVHSGQHYDLMMSEIFFRQLEIPDADYNLAVGSGLHGEMTGKIMIRFEKLLQRLRPDMVLVYGDTNSTLAGALAAAKLCIPVGHIEAGMRSYRMDMPEEINRRLTDHISALLFCPTEQAINNLKKENIKKGIIHSGDLMYELIESSRNKIAANKRLLDRYHLKHKQFLLMTMHRAGNVDDLGNLEKIVNILLRLNMPTLFPVHPRTLKNLKKCNLIGRLKKVSHVRLLKPLAYLDNLTLISNARTVLTDSGGIQKESVFLGTPCLTLRDETEWTETLKWGNYLVGLSIDKIQSLLNKSALPTKAISYKIDSKKPSEIIISSLLGYLRGN